VEAASDRTTAPDARDSRETILDAAARVIARRGVRGMKVEEVAAEAGVSTPLLYYHFDSRSGLVRAALGHASDRAPSAVLRRIDGAVTGLAAVERALLAELGDDPDVRENAIVWGEVSASAVFDRELRMDVRAAWEAWRAAVAEAIRTGIADGSIRDDRDPDQLADVLVTLVDGLCTRWLTGALSRDRAREMLAGALRDSLVRS
jgi:AcrR family transcriptional regulator